MNKSLIFLIALFSMTSTALAQRPNRQLTPEQMRARQEARQAELDAAERPIRALNSLWIEELTWMEIRDAIRDGNTTVLVLTGGVESNGPHLASGKHNYSNKLMGESVAQALRATLISPLVTLEPGNPTGPVTIGSTGPMVSQATYIAWLTDIGDSLRSMGFTQVYFLGDSGGNRCGMQAAADELNDRYGGVPTQFHHVPEFYNHDKVRQYIQETLGIPEEMEYQASSGSDGIHEELSITSVMSVIDPTSIRFDQRVEGGRASINGISLLPLSDTQSLGRMVIDFRTRLTVEAIKTLRVGPE